jgi:mitochondrial inner membrane protease subunit 1
MLGPSMLPTFRDFDVVVEDCLSLRLDPKNLARGDIITLKSPMDPNRIVCKRILGLPGDVVCVDPTGRCAPSTEHVKIPQGHIWIMGDNADASRDSRFHGPVSMALVQAKVVARVCFNCALG